MKLLTKRSKTLLTTTPEPEFKETKKPRKSHTENTLPSDAYKDEITPIEIPLNKDGKLIVSVKRGGEFGLPKVDIRYYATTEVYTGFTKKGVNFNLDILPELKSVLCDVIEVCDEKGLFEDFED